VLLVLLTLLLVLQVILQQLVLLVLLHVLHRRLLMRGRWHPMPRSWNKPGRRSQLRGGE